MHSTLLKIAYGQQLTGFTTHWNLFESCLKQKTKVVFHVLSHVCEINALKLQMKDKLIKRDITHTLHIHRMYKQALSNRTFINCKKVRTLQISFKANIGEMNRAAPTQNVNHNSFSFAIF